MERTYGRKTITTKQNPLLDKKGGLSVIRSGNIVTLKARVPVFGDRADEFNVAVMSYWDKLSFADADGTLYKSDVKLIIVEKPQDAVIRVEWAEMPDDRSQGMVNGTVKMDISSSQKRIHRGIAAHEFGHAYFGLKDGYENSTVTMPNGYRIFGPSYSGMEGSVMADSAHGVVRPEDLKELIKAYETNAR